MNLEELNNIDFNDVSSWPLPVKIVGIVLVCGAILFAGYWFILKGEQEQLEAAEKKEVELRATFSTKKALAINLPAYKQQMEEMRLTFGSLLRQLPNSTEVPDLLVDITQAGLGRGLEFALFKPEKERPVEFYAELPISLKVSGTYHELALFISDVAALPRIVTFGNITIAGNKKGDKLSMAAQAKTYRYLDQSEMVGQQKPKGKGRRRR